MFNFPGHVNRKIISAPRGRHARANACSSLVADKQKELPFARKLFLFYMNRALCRRGHYIMPPMPPMPPIPPGGIPGMPPPLSSSGCSATMHSVVRSRPATLAAFCRAKRVTLAGSMTPALIRSSYYSVSALKPMAPFISLTCSTMTEPSRPALLAIWRTGSSRARAISFLPRAWSPLSSRESRTLRQRR